MSASDGFSVVGKPVPRLDAWEKVTGRAVYAGDMKIPGMLYGKVLRSPLPHATLRSIDTARAARVPGVRIVLTSQHIGPQKFGAMIPDETPLARGKIRFAGEEIAAVAALSESAAEEAVELIRVEYEPLPAVFDPEEALLPGATKVHDGGNVAFRVAVNRGDPDRAFSEAALVVEDRFSTSAVHHVYIEPQVCVAEHAGPDRVTLWAPIQDPFLTRRYLAQALGLDEARVRVIQTTVGGGFGGKRAQRLYVIGCLLAMKSGLAVRMMNSRKEDFCSTLVRVPMIIRLRTAVARDGTLLGREKHIVADNGAYCNRAPAILMSSASNVDNLYRCYNIKTEAKLVYTNKVPTGDVRGFGSPQMAFATESQMDSIAEKLGMDPIELRLKNATRRGDTTVHGWTINSCGLAECIQKVAQELDHHGGKQGPRRGRGVGLACAIHVSGAPTAGYDGSMAAVKIGPDGRVTLCSGEGEIGQGASTALAQMAAEELGLAVKDVTVTGVDTDTSYFSLGAWATRVTTVAGNAVRQAAIEARKKLLTEAAEALEARTEDLEVRGGRVGVIGAPAKSLSFGEIARTALLKRGGEAIVGEGVFHARTTRPDPQRGITGNFSTAYGFAAHGAEVEVNVETGTVDLVRLACAHDVGKAINPLMAEGQVEGGATQGAGYALSEEITWEDGVVANPRLADYRTPTSLDVGSLTCTLVESQDPRGPFGAKGVGEPAIVPTAPAIANAVYDAVGVRIRTLPLTPQRILEALKHKQDK